jgi:hypothetical protein
MINGSDLKPLVLYCDGFVCMQLVKLVLKIAMSFVRNENYDKGFWI